MINLVMYIYIYIRFSTSSTLGCSPPQPAFHKSNIFFWSPGDSCFAGLLFSGKTPLGYGVKIGYPNTWMVNTKNRLTSAVGRQKKC